MPYAVSRRLAGWYLVDGLQLFHVNHVRNPDNKGRDWLASCTELVGDPAVYTPAGGDPVDTRCFVIHDAPFIGEHSQTVVYRARLELPLIEVGRAKKGDRGRRVASIMRCWAWWPAATMELFVCCGEHRHEHARIDCFSGAQGAFENNHGGQRLPAKRECRFRSAGNRCDQ